MRTPISLARTGVLALLLGVAAQAAAQAPAQALALSASAASGFSQDLAMDLQVLDAFETKRRASNTRGPAMRTDRWTLFGRIGPMRFSNQLSSDDGTQFSLRGDSRGLGGKIYIGMHRRF